MNRPRLRVPLSWVATTEQQKATNFGDGLSAVMVTAMTNMPVERANFDQDSERMVAVGTIGQNQKNGTLHIWGTGIDADRNPMGEEGPYRKPPNTAFTIYATRGPDSAATFERAGLTAPKVYGDPVWLLPRIWPLDDVERVHELGIILHISELEEQNPESVVKAIYERYKIPPRLAKSLRIINTYCAATPAAMRAKVSEILSCKRIVSTSLHGLVICETYGIPCAWFATEGKGEGTEYDLTDPACKVDHRIKDFYRGLGRDTLRAYRQDRKLATNWKAVMAFVDKNWKRVENFDSQKLIDAFPLPLRDDIASPVWTVDDSVYAGVAF